MAPISGAGFRNVCQGPKICIICVQEFGIHVIPVTLSLESYVVHIVQGHLIATITNETLVLTTNGNRSTVYYEVARRPTYGELMVDWESVTSFTQSDVDSGRLSYVQLNKTSAYDDFVLNVRDSVGNEIVAEEVEVNVDPLIRVPEDAIKVDGDGPFQITVDMLDAGPLKELTGSEPEYDVVLLPRLGTLSVSEVTEQRRRRRRRREEPTTRRNGNDDETQEEIESSVYVPELIFSHDDVVNNRVTYTPSADAALEEQVDGPQEDGFGYILRAEGAQPAVGSLRFEVTLPPASEPPPVYVGDDDHYIYMDDVDDDGQIGSEYVTTALIVAGGVLTSICSIISYRCYRLSRRRRWKRRQREMEALRQDEQPETVERHAADLHPSEPLLTRSAWTEPMHVAASESELRRIRAEHWMTSKQSRQRLNDALRSAGVQSPADDQTQGPPADTGQDQTLPRGFVFPGSQNPQSAQSAHNSDRKGDVPPQSAWLDSLSRSQPYRGTSDDGTDTQTLDRQRGPSSSSARTETLTGTSPTDNAARPSDTHRGRADKLLSWFDQQDTASPHNDLQRSTSPTSTGHSHLDHDDRTIPESGPTAARVPVAQPLDTDRYSYDRQTPTVGRSSHQRQHPSQDAQRSTPDHSSVPSPVLTERLPDALRSTTQRFGLPPSAADRGAQERDELARAQTRERGADACADGSHCDDVTRGRLSDDNDLDGGYVTGSRPPHQHYDAVLSRANSDEAAPTATAQQVVYDWDKVDPQLLDLCRKTSPVLDKNQYWV